MLPDPLPELNRTEFDYSCDSTIAEVFQRQATQTPDAIAVIANDRELTFRELDQRSNRIARQLQNLGVKPETLVGIAIERSENLVIGMLAILKAGGAYVPMDPHHPIERLALVIEDSGMNIVLASDETRSRLPADSINLTMINVNDPVLAKVSPSPVTSVATSHNLAYVIYTSGSTGKPKGVMVEHRNVLNLFSGMDRAIGCEPGTWLAVTSVAFDISVLELLWTLTRGFKVVVHGEDGTSSIADEIPRHCVTHLQMTPSLARILTLSPRTFSALGSLKQILLGGETVPVPLILRLRQVFNGEIYNMYGPTETTIWSTSHKVDKQSNIVSIGRPIANTQIYLLDSEFKPVKPADAGELFIGGEGVARGYWNRPELTAEMFIDLPLLSPHRIYRTGDLARLMHDGNLEFLGRADFQVKLRGHRIEPGEIEALLEQCPGITQAVIVLREDREGNQRLVAYLVAEPEASDTIGALRTTLGNKLPAAMVPSAFVFLSELPLTGNGKIDRKALLTLLPPGLHPTSTVSYAPGESLSDIELVVTRAWQEVLGVSEVGLNENFFDLGAHSLTVAEVQVKLQNALQREVSILDLFQFPTITSLSGHLAGTQSQSQLSDRAERRRLARQH